MFTPRYSWNIAKVGIQHQSINQSISQSKECPVYLRFCQIFSPQTWTDVSKNSPKTAKNTEKWLSRNISGNTCSQTICVWATLIQVNQDDSASVWWTTHGCIVFGKTIGRYSFKNFLNDETIDYLICIIYLFF